MRQIWRGLASLTAMLAVSSCEVPVDPVAVVAGAVALPASDAALAARLYAGDARTPAGFVSDSAPASFLQTTTYHVKSQHLNPNAATQHEVCTDDWNEALAWSEQVAVQAPAYLDLVGNETTERYYEFDRVPRGQPERYARLRVFRCAYLDRTTVDLASATPSAGTFNRRPLDGAALRELSEYLWLFTVYNNPGHAVAVSESRAANTHTVVVATLEIAAGGGVCDRVAMRDWTHTVNPASGALTLATTFVREFGVRRDLGTLASC